MSADCAGDTPSAACFRTTSSTAAALTPQVRDLMRDVEAATGAPVTLLDTGPHLGDVIELV